jgi:predicted DNA-binding protein
MTDATRFQFRLPAQQKAQLDSLAKATNLSSADVARLAIDRLLESVKQEAR